MFIFCALHHLMDIAVYNLYMRQSRLLVHDASPMHAVNALTASL